MKPIVLVAGKDPLAEGSAGHSNYVVAHALAALRAGYEPHLFCVGPSAGVAEEPFGILHRVASRPAPYRQTMIAFHAPRVAAAIASFLRTLPRPHLVHSFGLWGDAARRLAGAGGEGTRPVTVLSMYTSYPEEIASRLRGARESAPAPWRARLWAERLWTAVAAAPFERGVVASANAVLVNYDSVRRLLERRYGRLSRCRRITYSPPEAFAGEGARRADPRPGAPSGPPILVAVSRHDPRKGVDVLLRALARVRRTGAPFRAVIAGEGPLLAAHEALCRRLGLSACVDFPGRVASVRRLLGEASLFVLPSREEQSGSLALLEALAAGLPVVASGCDGIPEDVTPGREGLLVAPGDPAALGDAIAEMLRDSDRRSRCGTASRETFQKRFSPELFSRELAAVYAELGVPA